MTEQKEKGYKELEQLKHSSTQIQKVVSNIVITEKNEKLSQITGRYARDLRRIFR